MFTSTCILMRNNGMPPRVAGNRLSSYFVNVVAAAIIILIKNGFGSVIVCDGDFSLSLPISLHIITC